MKLLCAETGTTFDTMCQRQLKPCPFNSDHDVRPLSRMGIASTWEDPSYNVPVLTKPCSFNPEHDVRPLNWMGIASTWLLSLQSNYIAVYGDKKDSPYDVPVPTKPMPLKH
ncbi:hypothetical protein MRX96_058278 [Rhipicephalus microplus]